MGTSGCLILGTPQDMGTCHTGGRSLWSETAARGQEVPAKVQREWGQPYQHSPGKAGAGEPQPGAILGCTVRVKVLRREGFLQLRPHAIIQGVNAESRS